MIFASDINLCLTVHLIVSLKFHRERIFLSGSNALTDRSKFLVLTNYIRNPYFINDTLESRTAAAYPPSNLKRIFGTIAGLASIAYTFNFSRCLKY